MGGSLRKINFSIFKKRFSLNGHVLVLVFAAIIPFFAFSAVIMSWLVTKERTNNERLLGLAAKDLAISFDQEVNATVRTLQILTTSSSLGLRDFRRFHTHLVKALGTQASWVNVSLHDQDGKWLMSATRERNEPLDPDPETTGVELVLKTAKPAVSGIFPLPVDIKDKGKFGFAVLIPVIELGKTVFVLSATLGTETLQRLALQSVSSPEEIARGMIDSNGIIAARSLLPDKYVGKHVSPCFADFLKEKPEGSQVSMFDGIPVYTSVFRAPLSGWSAAVSIRQKSLEARANRAFHLITFFGVVLLIVSGIGAAFFSRQLAQMIRSAARGAAALARGESPSIPDSRIAEVEQLKDSLVSASELLQSRERLLSEHLNHSNKARAEAEKANRAKSEFLANMSHELRTPLGIVLGITDLVAKDIISPEEREKNLEIMRRNGERLLRLINDILDLEKFDAQKLTMENIEFSFPDLISEIITDFEKQVKDKGLELIVTNEGAVPRLVNSDPVRLRQVIDNLLANAIKFTEKGHIEVHIKAERNALEITVRDTGIGLSEEQQLNLFEPFTQGDSSHTRKYGGTGLGLALAKRIAQGMGGDVQLVESQLGLGSTFRTKLNLKAGRSSEAMGTAGSVEPARPVNLTGCKILLAEDSPDNAALFVMYLKHAGANVDVAENGLEAVNKVRSGSYDVVLMDIQMPVMDGHKATKELRKQGFTLPIVALTAHALNDQKEKAFDTGFTGYVTKPVQPSQLLKIIERHFGSGARTGSKGAESHLS